VNELELKKIGFISQEQFDFPKIINLCVLRGSCPCECVHCPVGLTPKEERGAHFGIDSMKLSLFKKIVDEIAEYPSSVLRIHSVGEPILWKALLDALEYTHKKKVKNWIFTCLVTKDKKILETLANNCSIIEISVNSFDSENYKQTKGIDEFNLVKSNIEFLSNLKKKNKLDVRILATRVESEDKEYDKAFVEFWKNSGLVDDSFIRSYHSYNSTLLNKFGGKVRKKLPCLVHWARFNVDSSGEVVICFNELFKGKKVRPELLFGNLNNDLIKQIWHSEPLELVRKAQLLGDYSIVHFGCKLPCEDCVSCQEFDPNCPTSENQLEKLNY